MDKLDLKPCPFCDGEAVLIDEPVRSGYGEYEQTHTHRYVTCAKCHARGPAFVIKHLVEMTTHTVSDFRYNPVLRAKVENEYDAYVKQTAELAVEAWNRRAENG